MYWLRPAAAPLKYGLGSSFAGGRLSGSLLFHFFLGQGRQGQDSSPRSSAVVKLKIAFLIFFSS